MGKQTTKKQSPATVQTATAQEPEQKKKAPTAPVKDETAPAQTRPPVADTAPAEKAARKEADKSAATELEEQRTSLAKDWQAQDKSDKDWLMHAGARIVEILTLSLAIGVKYKEAIEELTKSLRKYTGDGKETEIPRCQQVYYASVEYGPEDFALLGIRAQKEFATTMEREYDEETGLFIYSVDEKKKDLFHKLFQLVIGKMPLKGLPKALSAFVADNRNGKDGADKVMYGAAVAALLGKAKIGINPFDGLTADQEKEIREKAAADRKKGAKQTAQTANADGEKQEGKQGEETATSERPAGQEQLIRLDVKPRNAAPALCKAIVSHPEKNHILKYIGSDAKEIGIPEFALILEGMTEGGRTDELNAIRAMCSKEIFVYGRLKTNKGMTRAEALALYAAEKERISSATSAS